MRITTKIFRGYFPMRLKPVRRSVFAAAPHLWVQLKLLQIIEPDFSANPEDYITLNFLFDEQIVKIMDSLGKVGL